MTCACEHIPLCHQYLTSSRTNTGHCLAPECRCERYEETA